MLKTRSNQTFQYIFYLTNPSLKNYAFDIKESKKIKCKIMKIEKKIAFHCYSDFETSILNPVYNILKDEFNCLFTMDVGEVLSFKPSILILANHHYHYFRGNLSETIIIWTRHGFANKNSLRKAIEGTDFACVSSEWVKEDCIKNGWIPRLGFWITGFVPMDKIFSGHLERPSILPPGFPFGRKTLLYAPTWNRYFTSAEEIKAEHFEKILDKFPQLNIIIKPHPLMSILYRGILGKWKKIKDERLIFVENASEDIYQFFPYADILFTDASSVMFYFLAMDKPIILFNNPRRFREKEYFDPFSPEWKWRDMGEEVENFDELISAIEKSIFHPEEKLERRAFYRKRVFGDLTDGRSAERIAEKVRALLAPDEKSKEWVEICWNAVRAMNFPVKGWKRWKLRRFLSKIGKYFNLMPPLKLFIKRLIKW
jgi:hypothetical protein